jgi:hypothetical protein
MLLGYLHFTFHPPHRTAVTVLVVLLCALPPAWWIPERARRLTMVLTRRGSFVLACVGFISLAATSSLALKRGLPLPVVHDEFSYLLAADTFANGRLTNPTPPAWEHFETMHVLVTPTYQSKYPPGQGLVLAFGQACFGHPIWGVWIVTALACMAVTWTLLAVVPPRWAMIGGLITAVHPQMLEWGQRYWGGSLAVLGGALLVGAMLRIGFAQSQRAGMFGVIAGAGLGILANVRPFEGALLGVLTGAALLLRSSRIRAAILGITVTLVPVVVWTGYYNWRVTGDALRLPYQEHQRQYGYVPLFLFQSLPELRTYRHPELEQFHVHDQRSSYDRRQSPGRLARGTLEYVYGLGLCVFGNVGALAIPAVVLPWALWKDRRVRLLLIVLALFVTVLLTATFVYGHYAAPAAGVVAAMLAMLMRRMHVTWGAAGRMLARVTVGLTLLWSRFFWQNFLDWRQDGFPVERHRLLEQLRAEPGKQLVLVRYGAGRSVHEEWVYNEAHLENADVVWARSIDAAKDRELTEHFRGRRIWMLVVGKEAAQLSPAP